ALLLALGQRAAAASLPAQLEPEELTKEDAKTAERALAARQATSADEKWLPLARGLLALSSDDVGSAQRELGTAAPEGTADPHAAHWVARLAAERKDHKRAAAVLAIAAQSSHEPSLALDAAREIWLTGDLDKAKSFYAMAASGRGQGTIIDRELG